MIQSDEPSLIMISAMYENGGNMTHRFLDGHPQMLVYPFESQLGTRLVQDELSAMFPLKYRWPIFALHDSAADDYGAIIDEECRVRAKTPHLSKFRHMVFEFSDDVRAESYARRIAATGRSTGRNVSAFFGATFDAWHNYRRSGRECFYVGYSPIVVVDSMRIAADCPDAHLLHIVRNPFAAYADTKTRPAPLTLTAYMRGWATCQAHALQAVATYPTRVRLLRAEDIMADPARTLGAYCEAIGAEPASSLAMPSWNGEPLEMIHPWGTIREPTLQASYRSASELSDHERSAIRSWAGPYLERFGYR